MQKHPLVYYLRQFKEEPKMARCPTCGESNGAKYGKSPNGKQRYRCLNENCSAKTYIDDYNESEYLGKIYAKIMDMVESGESVADISMHLSISREKVISCIKTYFDEDLLIHRVLEDVSDEHQVSIMKLEEPIDEEEIWKRDRTKEDLLWQALDHESGKVLAYVKQLEKSYAQKKIIKLLSPHGVENFLLEEEV